MLVGEVRRARPCAGWIWRLSGGNQRSASVRMSSKKRHVRRAVRWRRARSAAVRSYVSRESGRLTRRATYGAAIQAAAKGSATIHEIGSTTVTAASRPTPHATESHIEAGTSRAPASACCAVVHSRRCLCETNRRHSVRPIASSITTDWWARNTTERPIWRAFMTVSDHTRRIQLDVTVSGG